MSIEYDMNEIIKDLSAKGVVDSIDKPISRMSGTTEEVIIQLYCRIGICLKHHPHDLADYLKAWDY